MLTSKFHPILDWIEIPRRFSDSTRAVKSILLIVKGCKEGMNRLADWRIRLKKLRQSRILL